MSQSMGGADLWEIGPDYAVTGVAGEGGCGLVLRGRRRRDGLPVAIKVHEKLAFVHLDAKALTEAEVLRSVRSERVVRMIEVLEDADHVYIVLEYIPNGDLIDLLTDRSRHFGEAEALRVIEGVLEALAYLHERGISHRDVKLDNIMLPDGNPARAKLIDFDLAYRRAEHPEQRRCSEYCGTREYRAPEIVSRRPYVPEAVDMWCTGVVLYTLIARRMPFESSGTYGGLEKAIMLQDVELEGGAWDGVSERTKQLVRALTSKDPRRRPDAETCLREVREILPARGRLHLGAHDLAADLGGLMEAVVDAVHLRWFHFHPLKAL